MANSDLSSEDGSIDGDSAVESEEEEWEADDAAGADSDSSSNGEDEDENRDDEPEVGHEDDEQQQPVDISLFFDPELQDEQFDRIRQFNKLMEEVNNLDMSEEAISRFISTYDLDEIAQSFAQDSIYDEFQDTPSIPSNSSNIVAVGDSQNDDRNPTGTGDHDDESQKGSRAALFAKFATTALSRSQEQAQQRTKLSMLSVAWWYNFYSAAFSAFAAQHQEDQDQEQEEEEEPPSSTQTVDTDDQLRKESGTDIDTVAPATAKPEPDYDDIPNPNCPYKLGDTIPVEDWVRVRKLLPKNYRLKNGIVRKRKKSSPRDRARIETHLAMKKAMKEAKAAVKARLAVVVKG